MRGGSEVEAAWLNTRLGEPGYLTGTDAKTAGCDTTLRTGLLDPPFNTPRLPLRLCRLRSSTWAPAPRTGATNAARSARDPRG